jgi:hypothetical protein
MVQLVLAQTELEQGATAVCYFDSLVLPSEVFPPNASSPYFLSTVITHNINPATRCYVESFLYQP